MPDVTFTGFSQFTVLGEGVGEPQEESTEDKRMNMRATGIMLDPGVLDISNRSRVADVSMSTTAAVSVVLGATTTTGGVYDVLATADCFIAVSADPSTVTTANGYPLLAGNVVPVYVPSGERIGAIMAASTGTLTIHRTK
jgi:hypothetical protein